MTKLKKVSIRQSVLTAIGYLLPLVVAGGAFFFSCKAPQIILNVQVRLRAMCSRGAHI